MDNGERGHSGRPVSGSLAAVHDVLQRMRASVQAATGGHPEGELDESYRDLQTLERALLQQKLELQALALPAGAARGEVRSLVDRLSETLESEAGEYRVASSSLDGLLEQISALVTTLEGESRAPWPAPAAPLAATEATEALTIEPKVIGPDPAALGPVDPVSDFRSTVEKNLALLRQLLSSEETAFEPQLDARAPLGHSCEFVDRHFGCARGAGLAKLEGLADLGLLQRELINRVHTCPTCQHCQINFREQCPSCHSISLEREQIVHHFRCGYTGLESEYARDFELVCPKCRKELFQLGQDFDRPHETYICRDCHYLFEEPELQGQCLHCAGLFHAAEADEVRVFRYRPTPLTIRAVELNRLTGLEVDSILYDADLQVATRDFLDFVVKRELIRLGRYTTAFSTCRVALTRSGRIFPIFREGDLGRARKLCILLSRSLRALDLVTRLDAGQLGILMPESGTEGPGVVEQRLFKLFGEFQMTDDAGRPLTPQFESFTWSEPGTTFEQVKAFFDGEQGEF